MVSSFTFSAQHLRQFSGSFGAAVAAILLFLNIPTFINAQTVTTFSVPGTFTWTAPCGVTSVTAEVWGGGGAGGGTTPNGYFRGGGGGGGGFARSVIAVVPGASYTGVVGAGGVGVVSKPGNAGGNSSFNNAVHGYGGAGGQDAGSTRPHGAGGAGGSGTGTATFSGGAGSAGSAGNAGSGGGGSGNGGAGQPATSTAGGAGGTGTVAGGNGATGRTTFGEGIACTTLSGGGSGGFRNAANTSAGGNGGAGQVRLTYTVSLPPVSNATISAVTTNSLDLQFSAPAPAPSGGYLILRSTSATVPMPVDGTTYPEGSNVTFSGNSYTVVKNGAGLTLAQSGLNPGTRYYYYLFSRHTGCPGSPVYSSAVTVSATTCPLPAAASNLALSAVNTTVNGSFSASPSSPAGYVIVRTTDPLAPVLNNGTVYPSNSISGDLFFQRGSDVPDAATVFSAPGGAGIYSFHVYAYTLCNGSPVYSPAVSQRIISCAPTSGSGDVHIKNVQFIGTLTPDISNPTDYTPGGYHNYTANTLRAQQIAGGVINMNVQLHGPLSTVKAWVDWNRNGLFETNEVVYDTGAGGVKVINVIFGFVIPETATANNYTVRVRGGAESGDPCAHQASGETEDYSFDVIPDCTAKTESVSAVTPCGPGIVTLNATGNPGTLSYSWYDTEFGAAISTTSAGNFQTPVLGPGNYTYYVTANNGSCSSTFRTPIKFRIDPVPTITFTRSEPEFCGTASSVIISTSADKEEATILEEKFEGAPTEIAFENLIAGNENAAGIWRLVSTPYVPKVPPYNVLTPALSSGYDGGNFAVIISDLRQKTNILNHYTLKKNLSFDGFTDLKLDFDLYFFPEEELITKNYLKIDYSLDNGANWVNLKTYNKTVGGPSRFSPESIALPAVLEGKSEVKFRFSLFALGADNEWITDIVALDNVRFYGNKSLPANFRWTGDSHIFYHESCSGPVPAEGAATICVKPEYADLESKSAFTVSAVATLANKCEVSRALTITNNNKIWNPDTTAVTWDTQEWLPTAEIPTAEQCVIVRKPLKLAAADGVAKNIIVETSGSMDIEAPRTLAVQNYVINRALSENFIVHSDANLIQRDDLAYNIGNITVKRDAWMKRLDYTYWSSPVMRQNLKTFSPATVATRFMVYEENTDLFTSVAPATNNFIPGKGYAVRAPNTFPADNLTYRTFPGVFVGVPNNRALPQAGRAATDIIFPLKLTKNGYNLVGNPYPSNIDFEKLVTLNGGKINNQAYFWTNINHTPAMQGSDYPNGGYVNNYATLTGTAGVPATYTKTLQNPDNGVLLESKKPNQFIKVGQGFIVKSTVHDENLLFKNEIRTGDPSSNFFNSEHRESQTKDRFWLQLTTPLGVVTTAAIGYVPGASDDYEPDYDAPLLGLGSDALFTSLETHRLAIQGRQSPLNKTDRVPLGMSHHVAGVYTLSAPLKEGVFKNGQSIYLKDNQTGSWTNLSEQDYTFDAERGLSEGRFEIHYEKSPILGTDTKEKNELLVYRSGDEFVIRALKHKITVLEVYDTSGRLIKSLKPASLRAVISAEHLPDSVYILKINQSEKMTTRKILK